MTKLHACSSNPTFWAHAQIHVRALAGEKGKRDPCVGAALLNTRWNKMFCIFLFPIHLPPAVRGILLVHTPTSRWSHWQCRHLFGRKKRQLKGHVGMCAEWQGERGWESVVHCLFGPSRRYKPTKRTFFSPTVLFTCGIPCCRTLWVLEVCMGSRGGRVEN